MQRKEYFVGVTYRDFAALARLADWRVEELVAEFSGSNAPTETSATYFARVLKGVPDWDSVIPFRRLITKYLRMVEILMREKKLRACPDGCGAPLFYPRQQKADHAVCWRLGRWSGTDWLAKQARRGVVASRQGPPKSVEGSERVVVQDRRLTPDGSSASGGKNAAEAAGTGSKAA
jgi:hypothetical protein